MGRILAAKLAQTNGVVAAVCHGVAALLSAKDAKSAWAFQGRELTGLSSDEEVAFGYANRARWLLESPCATPELITSAAPFLRHTLSPTAIW